MLLFVAANTVFTELPKAVAAAKGDANAVKSFSDYFEAEAYASGGSFDAAAGEQSVADAMSQAQLEPAPPPAKRTRYEPSSWRNTPSQPPKVQYSAASAKIRQAISSWSPHPDFERALTTNTSEIDTTTDCDGHRSDPDQEKAINTALEGKSFLLTGSAGVGKSYVLKRVIRLLREKGKKVVVTASTGCAAVGISGSTIHSALKLGIGADSANALCRGIRSRKLKQVRQELQDMRVLVIDEISMVDEELFEKAEAVVRSARCTIKGHPNRCTLCPVFGKVQVILCGDFFQLPPVAERGKETKFCFSSRVFQKTIGNNIFRLRRVHRQDDFKFVGMLNELRMGVCSRQTSAVLSACKVPSGRRHEEYDQEGLPVCFTKLYPYRNQVHRENIGELAKLTSSGAIYRTWINKVPGSNTRVIETGVKNLRVDNEIELRIGARILCMKNLSVEEGIANGSPGRIIGFYPAQLTESEIRRLEQGDPKVAKTIGGEEKDAIFPRGPESEFLARAKARKRAGEEDDEGVVVMRPKSKRGVKKESEDPGKVGLELLKGARRHPTKNCPLLGESPIVVPVVEFDNGVVRRIAPEPWEIRSSTGNLEAKVFQVPLCLGYALSVHKSQGMTLQRVQADLGGAFDCGQVYVALSRVSSIEGLRLPTFDPKKVMADKRVIEFERRLEKHTAHIARQDVISID